MASDPQHAVGGSLARGDTVDVYVSDAEIAEAMNDRFGDVGVAVDGGGVDVIAGEDAELLDCVTNGAALVGRQNGIGKEQRGVEMAEIEAKASPRNPNECSLYKSSKREIFEVA